MSRRVLDGSILWWPVGTRPRFQTKNDDPHSGSISRPRRARRRRGVGDWRGWRTAHRPGLALRGTGTLLVVGFSALLALPLRQASAETKAVNATSNLAAMLLFAARGAVLWPVALPMAAGKLLSRRVDWSSPCNPRRRSRGARRGAGDGGGLGGEAWKRLPRGVVRSGFARGLAWRTDALGRG
jgi:hypothetical protein